MTAAAAVTSPAAVQMGDGKKVEGRRVVVDVERGRTVENWYGHLFPLHMHIHARTHTHTCTEHPVFSLAAIEPIINNNNNKRPLT